MEGFRAFPTPERSSRCVDLGLIGRILHHAKRHVGLEVFGDCKARRWRRFVILRSQIMRGLAPDVTRNENCAIQAPMGHTH